MTTLFHSLARLRRAVLPAALAAVLQPASAATPARIPDTIAQRAAACLACHGDNGQATRDGYFPRLAGKPAGYLYNQLLHFRDGRRQYPGMNQLVAHLSDPYLREMADYFAGLQVPYASEPAVGLTPQAEALASKLAFKGDPARGLPACASCHGARLTGMQNTIPGTVGLPRAYLVAQLGAWKNGARKAHAPDCMAHVSRALTAEEIGALASWLAGRRLPDDMRAAPAAAPLPLACGSAPAQGELP